MNTALIAGAAGAAALTTIHQTAKHTVKHAPRVDVVGRRAVAGPLRAVGIDPPRGNTLQASALGLDLVMNTLWFSLAAPGNPRHAPTRGLLLGLLGGVGAVFLPPVLRLGRQPVRRSPQTAVMTLLWYTLGGLTAGLVTRSLRSRRR